MKLSLQKGRVIPGNVKRRLIRQKRVSGKTGNDIDKKAGKRPVTGMLDLTDIFEEIIHRFNDSTLPE